MGLFDKIFGNYSKKELAKIEPIKNKVLFLTLLRFAVKLRSECLAKSLTLFR